MSLTLKHLVQIPIFPSMIKAIVCVREGILQSKSCYQKATVRGSGQHAVLIGEGLRKGNGSDVFIYFGLLCLTR